MLISRTFADLTYCEGSSDLDLNWCTIEKGTYAYCSKESINNKSQSPTSGPATADISVYPGPSNDNYCGINWPDAARSCSKPCPTGRDNECTSLGSKYSCFYFTGCTESMGSNENDNPDGDGVNASGNVVNNNFCGEKFTDAMRNCNKPCPNGNECLQPFERCYAATGCDNPIQWLDSELELTVFGPDTYWGTYEAFRFTEFMEDFVRDSLDTAGIGLSDISFDDPALVQIDPPSGVHTIQIPVAVTGFYRPPPYLDMTSIIVDAINRNFLQLLWRISDSFSDVERIEATTTSDGTIRPTTKPPTISPVPTYDTSCEYI